MTEDEAIKIYASNIWEDWSDLERVKFQLFTERLCMPFEIFHESVEKVLNRPTFTHEFAYPENLRSEFLGEKQPPTLEEIMSMIPSSKLITVVI